MRFRRPRAALAAVLGTNLLLAPTVDACTRLMYTGLDGRILTARSMDWGDEMPTNLWIMPRGVARTGEAGSTSITWTSKYGSVIASAYDVSTCDGLNEAGLMVNLLWLAESTYPTFDGKTPTLSISLWGQYMLDNFATVKEAVAASRVGTFAVLTGPVPGQPRLATMHMSLSDASGDSAILEYIDGKLVIHHGREFQVMTNSPTYDRQLALAAYWKDLGGTTMLPGTNRAADRFARASFYVNAIPKTADPRLATSSVFSVIRNASVPLGISTPDSPEISSTRWRVVADHKDRIYYFESAVSPNVFWVDLKKVDLAPGTGTRTLQLGPHQGQVFAGETSSQFKAAKPFAFQPAPTG